MLDYVWRIENWKSQNKPRKKMWGSRVEEKNDDDEGKFEFTMLKEAWGNERFINIQIGE